MTHTPLLAQIGVLALLGAITTCLVIFGLGLLLGLPWDGHRRLGGGLLLLGLLGWGGGVALCVAFAG